MNKSRHGGCRVRVKEEFGWGKNNKKENSTNYIVPSEAKRKTKMHSTQFAQVMKSIKLQRLSGYPQTANASVRQDAGDNSTFYRAPSFSFKLEKQRGARASADNETVIKERIQSLLVHPHLQCCRQHVP